MYDFIRGDMILNVSMFDQSNSYTLSPYCFYHGYMGAQDKFILDKSCSNIRYTLVNMVETEKFKFDITNKADENGVPQDF